MAKLLLTHKKINLIIVKMHKNRRVHHVMRYKPNPRCNANQQCVADSKAESKSFGDFTMAGNAVFPIILTAISLLFAALSIVNAESKDLM